MTQVKKQKIIFVTPYFKPHTGGLENYAANIEKGLRDFGWETAVITSNEKGKGYQEEMIDGVKVYRLPTLFKISNTPIHPLWYFYCKKIFKNEHPDIINGHAPVPFISDMAACAAGDIPFVLTYHAGTMKKNKMLPDILIWLYEHILLAHTARKAIKIITPSQFVINTVLKKFKTKASVITPGVDTSLFKPSEKKVEEKNTVLFIARFANMYKMKGLFNLIKAMKILPSVTLRVIGEPIPTDAKNVVFLGGKTVEETVREMQKCTVLTLPSLAHAESFGMVLIEAMACRKPVIGTNIGGIPEVIRDGVDGILVPPGNMVALASAIKRIVNNPELAESLADRGFEKVTTKYTWCVKVQETHELFLDILKKNKNKNKTVIAHVCAYYPPHLGGLERVAQSSAEGLARRGYNVRVITSDKDMNNGREQKNNPKISPLRSIELARTPFAPALLWRLLDLPRHSLIHLHLAHAYYPEMVFFASKVRGIPYVTHFHLDVEPSSKIVGRVFLAYKRIVWGPVLRASKKVIACSEEQALVVEQKYGVKKENISVIPNAVSEDFFFEGGRMSPKKEFRLLYVGRLAVQKRVERIIEALSKLSIPAHLTIVGEGEERLKLEALSHKLQLKNISFAGKKNDAEMQEYHRTHDLFLISSDKEGGTPLVALEAMASGLPVIGTNVPGVRDLLLNTGILVDEPYAENFAKIIEELWEKPEKLALLSQKSFEKARQYSWVRYINQLEEVYSEIL